MIDLSNNNSPHVNFERLHHAGQRRVFLKLTEGAGFVDHQHAGFRARALAAGFRVGEYHFARPSQSSAREEATHFLRCMPKLVPGKSLRPCLDLEDPNERPSPTVGAWALAWLSAVYHELGRHPIIYGSPSYLEACGFKQAPAGLWLASYGRNDGREYPFQIPNPWARGELVAHQFTSRARVVGVPEPVDLSHVFRPRKLDVRRLVR